MTFWRKKRDSDLNDERNNRRPPARSFELAPGLDQAVFKHSLLPYFRPYGNLDTDHLLFAPKFPGTPSGPSEPRTTSPANPSKSLRKKAYCRQPLLRHQVSHLALNFDFFRFSADRHGRPLSTINPPVLVGDQDRRGNGDR